MQVAHRVCVPLRVCSAADDAAEPHPWYPPLPCQDCFLISRCSHRMCRACALAAIKADLDSQVRLATGSRCHGLKARCSPGSRAVQVVASITAMTPVPLPSHKALRLACLRLVMWPQADVLCPVCKAEPCPLCPCSSTPHEASEGGAAGGVAEADELPAEPELQGQRPGSGPGSQHCAPTQQDLQNLLADDLYER